MAIRTYKVTLDSNNAIAPEPVLLRQGDKTGAVVIDATLTDNGSPVSLSGLTPMFKANTSDGQAVIADSTGFNIIDESGGEFTYQVPSQLGSAPGKIKIAYFSLADSNGNQSTFDIVFFVYQAADMTRESAKDWVSNLNEIIDKYNQWVNSAHSSWQDFVNANKQIIESIDPGGTLLTEVIDARNGKSDLKTRLDEEHAQVTEQLATIGEQIGSTPNDISKGLWAEFKERRINIMWYFNLVPDKSLPRDEWDWTNAIQTAQNDLASRGGGTIEFPSGVFKYEKIYYYPDKISLISEMNAELLSVAADGYAITIRAFEELNVHEYLVQAHTHELRGIKFTAKNSNIFMFLSKGESSETGVKYASGWSLNRCSINGTNAIEINSHTWCINIDKCLINPLNGYGIYMPSGGSNYGERINITNSIIDDAGIAIFNDNRYGDIRINMTSIDYCDQAIVVRSGIVSVDQLFVESDKDLNWFDIEGYGAQLNIGAMQITDMYKSQRTKTLFRNEDSTNASIGAGLTFDSIKLLSGFSTSTFLIEGNGRVKAGRVDTYRDAYKPMIGRFLNKLAFGDCNSDKSINEWSSHRYSSEKAKLDTTDKYEGTASMKFSVSTNGYSAGQQIQFPCNAGDMIGIKYHIKTRNLQANNKMFIIERRFLNKNGDEISNGELKRITTDIDNWAEQFVVPSIEAPTGTAYVEFSMFGNSWTTDINVWMDDIVINVG